MPIDMKLTEQEKISLSTPSASPDVPKYPYGLKIRLRPEEMEKLNFQKDPEVNQEFSLVAKVKVVEVSSDPENPEKKSMELQIVEMDLSEKDVGSHAETVKTIYGE